jgi:hypothetical protein
MRGLAWLLVPLLTPAVVSDRTLHDRAIVVDLHSDCTQRMTYDGVDLAMPQPDMQVDLPKMKQGGLDAEFFSTGAGSVGGGPPAPGVTPGRSACSGLEQRPARTDWERLRAREGDADEASRQSRCGGTRGCTARARAAVRYAERSRRLVLSRRFVDLTPPYAGP